MKNRKKLKYENRSHNSNCNNQSYQRQVKSVQILTVVSAICSIHTRRIGTPISSAEKTALALTLQNLFTSAAKTGALFVVLDTDDLVFKIDTSWFLCGANPKTALENILCFSSVNKRSLNAAISSGMGKVVGGAA